MCEKRRYRRANANGRPDELIRLVNYAPDKRERRVFPYSVAAARSITECKNALNVRALGGRPSVYLDPADTLINPPTSFPATANLSGRTLSRRRTKI